MIRIIISAILLLILPIQVWSEQFTGSFTCKVKHSKVTSIEEGIVEEYDSYQDNVKVGESFKIKYLYENYDEVDAYFHIFNTEQYIINFGGDTNKTAYSVKTNKARDPYPRKAVKFEDAYYDWMFFEEDKLEIYSVNFNLLLYRYYKNDWSGLFYKTSGYTDIWVLGLDCRHKIDKFDEIASDLRKRGLMQ